MFPDLTRDDVFRLETRRLWLRWPRQIDGQAVSHLAGEKDVALMTASIPYPYPPEKADAFVLSSRRGNMEGTSLTLAISPKGKPGTLIGLLSLTPAGEGVGGAARAELGFWLGRPYWGEGFMTEAVQAMIDAYFSIAGGAEIVASVRVINPNSRRVLEKCGFVHQASGLRDLPARGGRYPVDEFRLERRNWASLKSWRETGISTLAGGTRGDTDMAMAAE
jgi:RimJ/RimL family protein N-acetyltransferase